MDIQTSSKKEKDPNLLKFYLSEPDYSRPTLEISDNDRKKIYDRMEFLYGKDDAAVWIEEIIRIMQVHYAHKPLAMIEEEKLFKSENRFTEDDIILITYGNLIESSDSLPLDTLREFCEKYLLNTISTIHLLPFFPYSSDRGFSITDYEEVDPDLGSWVDIQELKESGFKLMFDGVFNHASSKSKWFQEFLNMNPEYKDYFIYFSTSDSIPEDHLKLVVRPRTSDLLTDFNTLRGQRLVWTTFSPDQIDLNFKNPKVLFRILDILLYYIRKGADIIRLDAVTYIWAELGTSCVHLEQAHTIIKLFRDVLDIVAPTVALITETNVPHRDNIKYFGNGTDEAQMVYNFALPPLVLHTFITGNSRKLTDWAGSLGRISDTTTYFNFLDSHDGIGVMPVKDILTAEEIEFLALKVLEHRGFISYKDNGDGTSSPYELNITWYSALNRITRDESDELQIRRFIASRAIAAVIMGVPGIYLHSYFGSQNDADAVLIDGQTRSINRRNFSKEELFKALEDTGSRTARVASELSKLIQKRKMEKSFHPNAEQVVLNISESLFALMRIAVDRSEGICAVINIISSPQNFEYNLSEFFGKENTITDVLSLKSYNTGNGPVTIALEPYEVIWLKGTLS
jgi:glycosidase